MHDGARAHGTRFNCNIQVAPRQAVVPQLPGGAPQRQDFRVRGRIVQVDGPVVGAGYDCALADYDRSHGHFLLPRGPLRFAKRHPHESGIVLTGPLPSSRAGHSPMVARVESPRGHGLLALEKGQEDNAPPLLLRRIRVANSR